MSIKIPENCKHDKATALKYLEGRKLYEDKNLSEDIWEQFSDNLRSDYDFIIKALKDFPNIYSFLPEIHQSNTEVATAFISVSHYYGYDYWQMIPAEFHKNVEFIIQILKSGSSYSSEIYEKHLSPDLRDNHDIALTFFINDFEPTFSKSWNKLSKNLQNNVDFIIQVIGKKEASLDFESQKLYFDEYLFNKIPQDIRNDENFITLANNHNPFILKISQESKILQEQPKLTLGKRSANIDSHNDLIKSQKISSNIVITKTFIEKQLEQNHSNIVTNTNQEALEQDYSNIAGNNNDHFGELLAGFEEWYI